MIVPDHFSTTFAYDGDGRQVKSVINGVTTTFVGAHYEVTGSTVTKYYFAGATRIAMRENGTLSYLLGDHLGSSSVTTDASGVSTATMLYKAWGETRYSTGSLNTKYEYTGQRNEVGIGLHFYNARWYDDQLGRFIQADSVIASLQEFDRYSYVGNNPIRYTDPSGHCKIDDHPDDCFETGKKYSPSDFLDLEGYSTWERNILKKLYDEGGSDAEHGVLYILENDIHITIGTQFSCTEDIAGLPPRCSGDLQTLGDVSGWFEGDDLIVLNPKNNSYDKMPSDWDLSVIVHEAWHIEQGFLVSHSKHGELEAYQVGLKVYMALTNTPLTSLSQAKQDLFNSTTGYEYGVQIQKYQPLYWNNAMFSIFGYEWGLGLWIYPDEPLGGMR